MSAPNRRRVVPIEVGHDPDEGQVDAERERSRGHADDEGAEGHRGAPRMGDAGGRGRGAAGNADREAEPERREARRRSGGGGQVPRVIASTALRRPAWMAGTIAAISGDPERDEGHRDRRPTATP